MFVRVLHKISRIEKVREIRTELLFYFFRDSAIKPVDRLLPLFFFALLAQQNVHNVPKQETAIK